MMSGKQDVSLLIEALGNSGFLGLHSFILKSSELSHETQAKQTYLQATIKRKSVSSHHSLNYNLSSFLCQQCGGLGLG